MLYLTTMAKRKNAKRHITVKSNDIEYLRKIGKENINDRYTVAIYNSKWQLIEKIK